jgi:hypothetical protein
MAELAGVAHEEMGVKASWETGHTSSDTNESSDLRDSGVVQRETEGYLDDEAI